MIACVISRTFTFAAATSLVVFLATAGIAIRSLFVRDTLDAVVNGHHTIVDAFPHHFYVLILEAKESARPMDVSVGAGQIPSKPTTSHRGSRYWGMAGQSRFHTGQF